MKSIWWLLPVYTHPQPTPAHTSTITVTMPSVTANTLTNTPFPRKKESQCWRRDLPESQNILNNEANHFNLQKHGCCLEDYWKPAVLFSTTCVWSLEQRSSTSYEFWSIFKFLTSLIRWMMTGYGNFNKIFPDITVTLLSWKGTTLDDSWIRIWIIWQYQIGW